MSRKLQNIKLAARMKSQVADLQHGIQTVEWRPEKRAVIGGVNGTGLAITLVYVLKKFNIDLPVDMAVLLGSLMTGFLSWLANRKKKQ